MGRLVAERHSHRIVAEVVASLAISSVPPYLEASDSAQLTPWL